MVKQKKVISLLMTVIIFLLQFSVLPVLAEDEIIYISRSLEYPLFNIKTKTKPNSYIEDNGNSVFNIINRFNLVYEVSFHDAPNPLSFYASTWGGSYRTYYQLEYNDIERMLALKGDLEAAYTANLSNDRHINLLGHWSEKTSYAVSILGSALHSHSRYGNQLKYYSAADFDSSGSRKMGDDYKFVPTGTGVWNSQGLNLSNSGEGCGCGSSSVSNMAVMLADAKGPSVRTIYTTKDTSPSSSPFTQFHSGENIYIHLKFDEYIRFAMDEVTTAAENMKLNISMKRISNNSDSGLAGTYAEASLVSLIDDTLTFKYTVPEEINNEITNFYLSSVDLAKQSTWIDSSAENSETYDVSYFYMKGGNKTPIPCYDKEIDSSLYKVSSLVVDLAGNAVNIRYNKEGSAGTSTVKDFSASCYMDNVAPQVRKVSASHIRKNPRNVTERGSTFMTAGDTVGLWVNFNEEMLFNCSGTYTGIDGSNIGNIKAELNISKDGSAIIVSASEIASMGDGVNGPQISRLYFEFTVPDGARPLKYSGGVSHPLGINSIYSGNGDFVLSDTRGNPYSTVPLIDTDGGNRKMPDEELWLDNVVPQSAATIVEIGGKYKPGSYVGGDNPVEFYFPIEISDITDETIGYEYVSGTNGAVGAIRWENGDKSRYPFEYYIGGAAVPEGAAYKGAFLGEEIPITQIDGGDGNCIHIRMIEGQEYSVFDTKLIITPVDNAGNITDYVFPLDYTLDNIGPVITKGSYSNAYDTASGTGNITAGIKIKDINESAEFVECKWFYEGISSPEGDWKDVTSEIVGTDQFKELTLMSPGLASGQSYNCTLYIKALDGSKNTLSEESFNYCYDLAKPKYTLMFNTDPEEFHAKHSVIFKGEAETVTESVYRSATIAMIKIGNTDDYWVKSEYMPEAASSYYAGRTSDYEDIFAVPSNWDLEGDISYIESYFLHFIDWFRCTVTWDENNNMTITRTADLTDVDAGTNTANHRALCDLINGHYGFLNLTLIAANREDLSIGGADTDNPSIIILNSVNYEKMDYRLKSAAYQAQQTYNISLAPIADDGNAETDDNLVMGVNKSYTFEGLLEGRPQLLRSIDGAALKLELENTAIPEYGLSDIDFDSEDTYFELSYDDGFGSSEVYKTPLIAAASQIMQIPVSVAVYSGQYNAYVRLQQKASGDIDGFHFLNIFADKQTIDAYGLSKVESSMDFNGTPVPITTEFELAPGKRASEIFLSTTEPMGITFKADYKQINLNYFDENEGCTVHDKTHAYIKIWNESSGNSTGWVETEYRFIGEPLYTDAYGQPIYEDGYIEKTFTSAELIELAGESGVLSYRFMSSSADKKITMDEYGNVSTEFIPYTTPVQALVVRSGGEKPSLEMVFDPEYDTDGDITATVHNLESGTSAPEALTLLYGKKGAIPGTFTTEQGATISENGSYFFAAYDKYHNYSIVSKEVNWIDKIAPVLSVQNNSAGNKFSFTAEITDENASDLFISFDNAYSSLLGYGTGVPVVFDVPEAGSGTWFAGETQDSGIYRTVTAVTGNIKTITLEGVFKFDSSKPEGAVINRAVTLYAADKAGNESLAQSFTVSADNVKTAYTFGTYDGTGFTAEFSTPVIMESPEENTFNPVFETQKNNVAIFANGSYTIEYKDIFGEDREQNITVNAYDAINNVKISLSETGPTKNDVLITLDASANENITLDLPETGANMTVEPVMTDNKVKGAMITVKSNSAICFGIVPDNPAIEPITRVINIRNIDRTAPAAELSWIFSEDVDENGQTKGEVTVSLIPDEAIRGINGKATMHVFTLSNQSDYTFEYCDLAGNAGEPIIASLSQFVPTVSIVEKTLSELDANPPEYNMSIYKIIRGSFLKAAGYTKAEYDALVSAPFDNPLYLTSAMKLNFAVTDVNQTKLLLFNGTKSLADLADVSYLSNGEVVSGASVSGNSVHIDENSEFTIAIIDRNSNKTLVPVQITQIDKEPPTGEIAYIPAGLNSIWAYITLADNISAPGKIRMLNNLGVLWDPTYNAGAGTYYHEFTKNESFIFTFEDEACNVGTAAASANTIDDTAPVVTGIKWSPTLIEQKEDNFIYAPPDFLTNKSVIAYLAFSKNIRNITASLLDENGGPLELDSGENSGDYYSLSPGTANATVRFEKGARLQLTFTALNGMSGTRLLEVGDIIDKEPPVISVASDEPTDGSFVKKVNLTFVSDEPAYSLESGEEFAVFIEDSKTKYKYNAVVKENGTYTYRFADKVGNVSSKEAAITQIDNTAPVITLTGVPPRKSEAGFLPQKAPVTIMASINEKGSISLGGLTTTVEPGDEASFTIDANGYYSIAAGDAASEEDSEKNTAYKSFVIECIDKAAPLIVFEKSVLKVKEGTLVSNFEIEAMEGVYVSDNIDSDMKGKYDLTSSLTQEQLNSVGTYNIEYTATDSAGNTRRTARTVKVYDKNQPTIYINGEKTDMEETTFINIQELQLIVSIPPNVNGTEPYKLYYGKGLLTIGQIKSRGTLLVVDNDMAALTVTEDGFYTIQLITQSRETYITYIYVQK